MNKKITIYELLELIKENKAPEKIKVNGFTYKISCDEDRLDYIGKGNGGKYLSDYIRDILEYNFLGDILAIKIEMIEENKGIEKLKIKDGEIVGNWENGSHYNYTLSAPQTVLTNKINELIDVLNEFAKEEK